MVKRSAPRSQRARRATRSSGRRTTHRRRSAPRRHSTPRRVTGLGARLGAFFSQVFVVVRWGVLGLCLLAVVAVAAYHFLLPQLFPLERPLNLVIVSQDLEQSEAVVFVHISPETEKTIVAVLNGADRVEVLGGYGEYSIRSLYSLLQLEGKDDHFVAAAFSHALGVLVDEVVPVPGLTAQEAESIQLAKLLEPLVWQQTSQLTFRERLELFLAARTYRRNELHPEQAAEIAPLLGAHPLIPERIARNCQVAVINTTSTPGLATGVSELLEQSGAFVVRVANTGDKYERSVLLVSEQATTCTEVLARAGQLFPQHPEVQVSRDVPLQYRAHVVIMAGSDLTQAAPMAE